MVTFFIKYAEEIYMTSGAIVFLIGLYLIFKSVKLAKDGNYTAAVFWQIWGLALAFVCRDTVQRIFYKFLS